MLQVVSNNILNQPFDKPHSSLDVERHQGRLIFLEYTGEGKINSTALLVGKGITYDTGGLDIKSTFDRSVILILK